VPQGEETAFPLRAREVVAMGRYPHLGPWRAEGAEDRRIIGEALADVEAAEFAGRRFDSLSGGERQRIRIARALAQQGEALVLDEPSAGLDVRHEVELFLLCRRLVSAGRSVVIVTHNLTLAAPGRPGAVIRSRTAGGCGAPRDVLTEETLSRVYSWPVEVVRHGPGRRGLTLVVPLERHRCDLTASVCALLVAAALVPLPHRSRAVSGELMGQVADAERSWSRNARVSFVEQARRVTDASGRFRSGAPAGNGRSVAAIGYRPARRRVPSPMDVWAGGGAARPIL
jgi:hypothetical protein